MCELSVCPAADDLMDPAAPTVLQLKESSLISLLSGSLGVISIRAERGGGAASAGLLVIESDSDGSHVHLLEHRV